MPEALFREIEQAQIAVQLGLPELEIVPSNCSCCWEWWFNASDLTIDAWFGPAALQEMWDLLWQLVEQNRAPGESYWLELHGDQSKAWVVLQHVSANEIQIGIKSQDVGPCRYLSFRCEREALIGLLSEQMQHFVKHPLYRPQMDRLEQIEEMAIVATAPEWPWSLFPLWYTLNTELLSWQIKWLIFTSLENAPQFSQLNVHKKDPIDDLLIQCYWNCFLCAQLPTPIASESDYSQQVRAYTDDCQQIFAFAVVMDMKWRNNCVYNAEDPLTAYYDNHRSYLEHTHQLYVARLRWWLSHLKYVARLEFPVLYNWENFKSWEANLGKTHPDLHQRLGLKWRQNVIWQACLGKEITRT